MKWFFAVLLLLAGFIKADAQKYYEAVDSAESCIVNKDWGKAEMFIRQALAAEPDNNNNSLLLSNLGTVQRYQGKYADAIQSYSIALYMTPNAVTLLKNRASLYLEIDSVDLAFKDYEKVISLDNKDLEAIYNHGMIALEKKKMGVSKDDFDRIEAISPKSYYAINGKATWHKVKGNYIQAADLYGKVIKARPNVESHISRAECYLAMKRLADAEADIRTALDIEPENAYLYALRSKLDKLRYDRMALERDMKLAEKYGMDKKELKRIIE